MRLILMIMTMFASIVTWSTASFAQPASEWTHPANPSGAINIGRPSAFTRDEYAIDIFKGAQLWWQVDAANGFYSLQDDKPLDVDELGWVRTLPKVNGVEREVIAPFSDKENTRSGRYIVTWKGEGAIDYDGAVIDRKPNRWIIDVVGKQFHWIEISQTDPNRTGNYIRDLKIYRVEDEPLIKGGEIFVPEFIDKISKFRVLRVMDALNMNFSRVKDWSANRESNNLATWTDGAPVEAVVRLANDAKMDLWINVPHLATDDYVKKFAAYLKLNLDPNLRVYLEYSNEFFTDIFDQYPYFVQQGNATFGAGTRNANAQYYAYRASQIFDLFKPAFGAENAARVYPVLTINRFAPAQVREDLLTGPDIVRIGGKRPVDGAVKVLAIDGYIGFDLPLTEVLPLVTDPNGTTRLINSLRTGKGFSYPVGIANFRAGVRANKQSADQYGLQLFAYESGTAFANFLPGAPPALTEFFGRANRDPAIKDLYRDLYRIWNSEGRGLNAHFATVSGDGPAGNFATWDTIFSAEPAPRGFIPVQDNERLFSDPADTRPGSVFLNGRLIAGTPGIDTLTGTPQADRIYGGNNNDVMIGAGGADFMAGGDGGDVYLFALGQSNGARAQDNGRPNDRADQIKLTDIAALSQLTIKRIRADLSISDGTNTITLKNQFVGTKTVPANFIERLELSGGSVVDLSVYATQTR